MARSRPMPGMLSLAVGTAAMGAFCFGYHLGVVNGPLPAIAADLGFQDSTFVQGLVVSTLLACAAAGSLGGSGLADRLGRARAFRVVALPLIAGPLLSAAAQSAPAMLAGRGVTGLGIGLSSALVPLYISELAPPRRRGTLGTLNQVVICLGILGALALNVVVPASKWRELFVLGAIPAALLLLGALFVAPETPSWLALHGQGERAAAAAERLWGSEGQSLLSGDMASVSKTGTTGVGAWREALRNRGALTGAALYVLQQFSGVNAIIYFSSSVFQRAGFASAATASAAVGTVNVLGSVAAAGVIERAGRRYLLSRSWLGMGAAMLAMAGAMAWPGLDAAAAGIAVGGTLAYILAFSLGAGPVPALLVPEITPAHLRGKAMAMAMGTHWVCNWVVGQAFLAAVDALSVPVLYCFFGMVCLAAARFAATIPSPPNAGGLRETVMDGGGSDQDDAASVP